MDFYKLKNKIPLSIRNKFSKKYKDKFTRFLTTLSNLSSGKKGRFEYFKSAFSAYFKMSKSLGKPTIITVEPTNACDQKCPICETGNGELNRVKKMMKLDEFKHIIDDIAAHANEIMLYFMGETFINKDAYKMIKYSRTKNIFLNSVTNGNFVDAEKMLLSDISEIQVHIGGMTQKTHEIYRVDGVLKKAKKAIEELVALKKSLSSKTKIHVGFIVMKHNVHEIEEFQEYCKSVGVDEAELIKPCARNTIEAATFIPDEEEWWIYKKDKFLEEGKLEPLNPADNYCDYLYFGSNIYANGDVVPCCRDVNGEHVMGNVHEEAFEKIWNNKRYKDFRKKVLSNQKDINICKLCEGYNRPILR